MLLTPAMIPYKLVKKKCIYGNADTDSFLVSVTYAHQEALINASSV